MQDNVIDGFRKCQVSFVLDNVIAILSEIAAYDLHAMLDLLLLDELESSNCLDVVERNDLQVETRKRTFL